MHIPTTFTSRLRDEFPHLRARWSPKRQTVQIEQQVGHGAALPPIHIDAHDDDLVRAKDGYWRVMEVSPGDRRPCPTCGLTLKVPHLKFAEVTCTFCHVAGRDGRTMCGYFPLDESLLQYLRRTDPLRGAVARMADECDQANQRLMTSRIRSAKNEVEAATKDDFGRLFDIQQVGYTGRG